MELVADQVHTQLDNCTPTVGSLRFFALCREGGDIVRLRMPRRFLSCILWHDLLSSQHHQQLSVQSQLCAMGGGELLGWGECLVIVTVFRTMKEKRLKVAFSCSVACDHV